MRKSFDIVYDFDGTLTDVFYPRYDILKSINLDILDIIKNYKKNISSNNDGMVNLFMNGLIDILNESNVELTKENLCLGSNDLEFSRGVEEYFENIKLDCDNCNIHINHFVITSGLKEYIEKTRISKYLKEIYGSSYCYENGKIISVNEVIESKDKVSKIQDINEKSKLSIYDCNNMIYIGDGFTDYEAMKFVKENGGISICVYGNNLDECQKLIELGVVNEGFKRDYSKNSKLYNYIKEKISFSKVGEK